MNSKTKLFNVSSSPHVRSRLSTGRVMYDVVLALLPAAAAGIYIHGLSAFLVIAASVLATTVTESVFDYIAKKPNTIKDGSAVVTGLLLALCLPSDLPLYIPCLGGIFAILFVKCFFGGLGHNFMNPALAGRCFLLISFGTVMTRYTLDGVSAATPLAELAAGNPVSLGQLFLGNTSGVIGSSVFALLLGGIYLLVTGGITFEIPAAGLVSFTLFLALFGGHGFDPRYLAMQLCGGGIVMGAFFMATDPVTSPVTSSGQILFGILVGVLSGIFRVLGSSADSVSYAIIISNLAVPLIDEISIPVPYGYRKPKEKGSWKLPKSALVLCAITLIAGVVLSGVFDLTEESIEAQKLAANTASYQVVCPDAQEFSRDETLGAAVDALEGEQYGTSFGKAYINEDLVGTDASGAVAGYIISVTSKDGFDGDITLSVGLTPDGTVNGIAFTELNETAGMGMRCDEEDFKGQFAGVKTESFVLDKTGGASADNEINSISGASISSGAVVNAVNAALDFFAANVG